MKLKDLNIITFPDSSLHLKDFDDRDNELQCSIKSFDDLFLIAQAKQIMPHIDTLIINYLLAARCDRKFSNKEAFDLQIVADFINSMNFARVLILKPHSQVALNLIKNSEEQSVTSQLLIQCITENGLEDYSIISPDKGASRWITKELGSSGVIQCDKERDTNTGEIISVKFTDIPKEECIITDDICSNGGTFIHLAKELKIRGVKRIYLITTHFDEGTNLENTLNNLQKHIVKYYTTNSFTTAQETSFLNIMKL